MSTYRSVLSLISGVMVMFVIEDQDLKKSLKNCTKSYLLNLFLFVRSISLKDMRALCFYEPAFKTYIYSRKS
jgi:hypothetical protein